MAFQILQIVPNLRVRKVNVVEYVIDINKLIKIAISNPSNLCFNSFLFFSFNFRIFIVLSFQKNVVIMKREKNESTNYLMKFY